MAPASDVGAASLVLWRDPANDAATYAAKEVDVGWSNPSAGASAALEPRRTFRRYVRVLAQQ